MREESEALVLCCCAGCVVFFGMISLLYHVVAVAFEERPCLFVDEAISCSLCNRRANTPC